MEKDSGEANYHTTPEERTQTVQQAEEILNNAKDDYRNKLIAEEFDTKRDKKPDPVQKGAVREAQKIVTTPEMVRVVNMYDQNYRKLPKIINELGKTKIETIQKHQAELEWQETVREVTIPSRGNYATKYVLSVGQNDQGVFYYRTETRFINDNGREELTEAAQLTQMNPDYDSGNFRPEYTFKSKDVIDSTPMHKTIRNNPKGTVEAFTNIYEKVTPTKVQKVKKWLGRKLRFNKVI